MMDIISSSVFPISRRLTASSLSVEIHSLRHTSLNLYGEAALPLSMWIAWSVGVRLRKYRYFEMLSINDS